MIYVTSDLHGYPLEKFKALLEKAEFSKDDFLFVLGDVIDRGAEGVKLLHWMMLQPNVELILGNHEAMMLSNSFLFDEITEESIDRLDGNELSSYMTWISNGGQTTLDELKSLQSSQVQYILEYVSEASIYEEIDVGGREFILVHSGLGSFVYNKPVSEYSATDLLWTRVSLTKRYFDDKTVVFGHTPTASYGPQYEGKAVKTDTWINIDTGSAMGLAPMLLRLDDMKEFYAEKD